MQTQKIDWTCEECGEPILRAGTQLYCVNGCYEDDTRNFFSEDEQEAGIPAGYFPEDPEPEPTPKRTHHYNPCDGCGGEDCCCCEYGRGY